jgi:hypothetical protein
MKYFQYLRYLLVHRWYVMIECFRNGLYWRGLMHDVSKFSPDEFFPYVNFFYGNEIVKKSRAETGYYKPTDTGDKKFDFAWLLHQKRNRHHWQWWILPEDEGGVKILEMVYPYNLEMLCDWVGAGKAQGKFSPESDHYFETRKWYLRNKSKMQFHPETQKWIEQKLHIGGE